MSNRKRSSTQGRCPPKRKSGGCAPNPTAPGLSTYSAIVRDYLRRYQAAADEVVDYYRRMPSFGEALCAASFAETPNGKRHPHQYRLKRANLQKVYARLRRRNIEGCATFHELFLLIGDAIGNISGIGELMVYDTAHRLGAFLGLSPEYVYLHAGVRVGAVSLGLEHSKKWIDPSEFPKAFRRLTPQQLEDCLCIYKKELQAIRGADW